jgi:hypothetical protein
MSQSRADRHHPLRDPRERPRPFWAGAAPPERPARAVLRRAIRRAWIRCTHRSCTQIVGFNLKPAARALGQRAFGRGACGLRSALIPRFPTRTESFWRRRPWQPGCELSQYRRAPTVLPSQSKSARKKWYEATRVHHACWRRGDGVAVRRARTGRADAARRRADGGTCRRPGSRRVRASNSGMVVR